MKVLIFLLISLIPSINISAQDYKIFSHTFSHIDSTIKRQYVIIDVRKVINVKKQLTHIKYQFRREGNLLGVTLTYKGRELKYVSTTFINSPEFADQVQRNIEMNKDVTTLLLRSTEMVVYNSNKKIYTYLFIDNDKGILVMCHSLTNPILKVL